MIPIIILAIEDEDDREFMTRLYLDYRWLIFSKVSNIVHDRTVAEDLVHDVIVKLIDKLQTISALDKRRLAAYIVETAKSTAIDYMRKYARVETASEEIGTMQDPEDVEVQAIRRMDLEEMKLAWPELKDETRELLSRKYFLMQTDVEIADAFQVRPGSVRMMLTRARREVYQLIKDKIEG